MISPVYRDQVDLLIRLLPEVAVEQTFALKGGTAINLFVRDMPRLSVDIDLTYLPLHDRETALQDIGDGLQRIKCRLDQRIPDASTRTVAQGNNQDAKLVCRRGTAMVKVEVNTVVRGHLWPTRQMEPAQVVSHAELFGGKLCAALDRQHPRDLFDTRLLLDTEGLTDDVRLGFLASLLSHTRPMHELLRPQLQDRRELFQRHFAGMTIEPFTYEQFEETRHRLIREVHEMLQPEDRALLLGVKRGEPDWSLCSPLAIEKLPAVRWKLKNIERLKQDARKHAEQLRALEEALAR